jgi:DNA polymerase-3 subunit epsilon
MNSSNSYESFLAHSGQKSWIDFDFVAFDIETTGAYPLGAQICELGAVKWNYRSGIISEFHSLIKPTHKMSQFIIGIHGITNEMVANSPRIEEQIGPFYDFIQNSIAVAHHAPFDMGFVAFEFEKMGLSLPTIPALCTSLLARKVFTESTNHKLQTLIPYLGLPQGVAHRATDDARSCLGVAVKCMAQMSSANISNEKIFSNQLSLVDESEGNSQLHFTSISDIYKTVEKNLSWQNYSIKELARDPNSLKLIQAIEEHRSVSVVYDSKPKRRIIPKGIVRNPDGDFIYAFCDRDSKDKRFYLSKISSVESEF